MRSIVRLLLTKSQLQMIPKRCAVNYYSEECVVLSAKEAEEKYVASVHSQKHTELIRKISLKEFNSRANHTAFENNSLYFNKGSSKAAYLAAGSVIEGFRAPICIFKDENLMVIVWTVGIAPQVSGAGVIHIVDSFTQQKFLRQSCRREQNVPHVDAKSSDNLVSERVARGELCSAVAIVRPPGHHAEPDEAKGYDYGRFYPAGNAGSHKMVGEGFGAGYNINVPWERGRYGDADYFAVWEHILIPVARAFNPDIILISGGFDAAAGDPLGGCRVTPYGYSVMLQKLMQFAGGRIVMALEGGYNLTALANSVLACVETLLEDRPIVGSLKSKPKLSLEAQESYFQMREQLPSVVAIRIDCWTISNMHHPHPHWYQRPTKIKFNWVFAVEPCSLLYQLLFSFRQFFACLQERKNLLPVLSVSADFTEL
ncbi:hypothetical protein ACLOJK_002474 [Asimina triloba]